MITIGGVHVAWSRSFPDRHVIKPSESLKVQNVKVVCSKRSCSKPASNYVETIFYQGCRVTISARWLRPRSLFRLKPLVFLCIENSQSAVIFLSVITSKHEKFSMVKRSSVVLDLRRVLYLHLDIVLLQRLRLRDQMPSQLRQFILGLILILVVAWFLWAGTFPVSWIPTFNFAVVSIEHRVWILYWYSIISNLQVRSWLHLLP